MLWSSTLALSLVGLMCEWRMITPSWQGDAVNGITVNGQPVQQAYVITLPTFFIGLTGTLTCKINGLLNAMIWVHHSPLVIFGKSSFFKEHGIAFNASLFCDL